MENTGVGIIIFFLMLHTEESSGRKAINFSENNMRRLHQLALLKARILNGLNLPLPPSVNDTNGKPPISEVVLTQLHYQSALVASTGPSDNMVLLLLSEPTDESDVVQFNLNGNADGFRKKVKSVQLFIRLVNKKRRDTNMEGKRQKSRKIKIIIRGFHPKKNKMKRLTVKKLKIRKEKWLNLKLPVKFIKKVAKSKNKTLALKISCKRCSNWVEMDMAYKNRQNYNSNTTNVVPVRKKMLNAQRPYIIIHKKISKKKSKKKRRAKRDLSDTCQYVSNVTSCCTQPLYVNFTEIGWSDWIIYPQGFTTGTCTGSCWNGRNSLPGSLVCSPSETGALTVVYYASDNIIIRRTIPDVIDAACACQESTLPRK
ncbi:inhibin beta B chain [Patella vulgata]|uniref:inhibin beta B chain n=1 Tax=Patella vulgata TaxID=6465 RepID=UPI00217FCB56|nr:inhibin beta B chain [Patella vulgata]